MERVSKNVAVASRAFKLTDSLGKAREDALPRHPASAENDMHDDNDSKGKCIKERQSGAAELSQTVKQAQKIPHDAATKGCSNHRFCSEKC